MKQAGRSRSALPTGRKHDGYCAHELDNTEDERMVVMTIMAIITNNKVKVSPLCQRFDSS